MPYYVGEAYIRSQHRVFPVSCWPLEGFRTEEDLKRLEGYRKAFIQRRWNDSERLVLRAVPDKEFLHKNINNRDVYVDYGSAEDIPEDAYSLKLWRFDSVELK